MRRTYFVVARQWPNGQKKTMGRKQRCHTAQENKLYGSMRVGGGPPRGAVIQLSGLCFVSHEKQWFVYTFAGTWYLFGTFNNKQGCLFPLLLRESRRECCLPSQRRHLVEALTQVATSPPLPITPTQSAGKTSRSSQPERLRWQSAVRSARRTQRKEQRTSIEEYNISCTLRSVKSSPSVFEPCCRWVQITESVRYLARENLFLFSSRQGYGCIYIATPQRINT